MVDVAQWTDAAGAADLSQPDPLQRPELVAINGVQVAQFRLGNYGITPKPTGFDAPGLVDFLRNKPACTAMLLFRKTSDQTTTSRSILGFSTGTSAALTRFRVQHTTAARYQLVARRLDADAQVSVTSAEPVVTGEWDVITAEIDWANGTRRIRVDGAEVTGVSPSHGNTSDTSSLRVTIGGSPSADTATSVSEVLGGQMVGLRFWDAVLSPADLAYYESQTAALRNDLIGA